MAGVISLPFGGSVCFQQEANFGAGLVATTGFLISDAVTDVRLETGDINTKLNTISSATVAAFSATLIDPKLHIEWVHQPAATKSLASYCIKRNASCDLTSLAFQLRVNGCSTVSDLIYNCKGAKCNSFTISSTQGENWLCSADFNLASVATSTATVCIHPVPAIGGTYAAFNTAGSITWSPTQPGAYVTKSFSVTVNNNLSDYYTVGSNSKKAIIPGKLDVTGTCDISIDNGGDPIWGFITTGKTITSLTLNSGITAGSIGKVTLTSGVFDSGSLDVNTSGEGMISSIPFTFKNFSFTAGT